MSDDLRQLKSLANRIEEEHLGSIRGLALLRKIVRRLRSSSTPLIQLQKDVYEITRHWQPSQELQQFHADRLRDLLGEVDFTELTQRFESSGMAMRMRITTDFALTCQKIYGVSCPFKIINDKRLIGFMDPYDSSVTISTGFIDHRPLSRKLKPLDFWVEVEGIPQAFPMVASTLLHEIGGHVFQKALADRDPRHRNFPDSKWFRMIYKQLNPYKVFGFPFPHRSAPIEIDAIHVQSGLAQHLVALFGKNQQLLLFGTNI